MDNETEISVKLWSEVVERVLYQDTDNLKIAICTIMLFIFIISVVGNSLTCTVIYSDKTMHTITNYYLFNLALSDLLVSFAAPLFVFEQFEPNYIFKSLSFGEVACKVQYFVVAVLWNNCVLTMTVLAVERYVAICHPMKLKSFSVLRRVVKMIVCIWIVAVIETLVDIRSVTLIKARTSSICLIAPTRFAKVVNIVLATMMFLVPLAVMTFVYSMIAVQIRLVHKDSAAGVTFNKKNNIRRINKLVIALTAAFFVCWLPFFVIRVCIFVWDGKRLMQIDKVEVTVWRLSVLNTWFSSVLNPLLFSLMSSKFRH